MTLVTIPSLANAALFPEKSASGFCTDTEQLLSAADQRDINYIAGKLFIDARIPIHVVIIPSLARYQAKDLGIEAYAQQLFNNWGIGSQARNYGVLLLVSIEDRKARIQLGAAFDKSYDQTAATIMSEHIIPSFKLGDYSHGVHQGVVALDAMVRGLALPVASPPDWLLWMLAVGGIFIIAMIISLFRSGKAGWAWALIAFLITASAVTWFYLDKIFPSSDNGLDDGSSDGGGATGDW